MTVFVGIDPGKDGAIAIIYPEGSRVPDNPHIMDMPDLSTLRSVLSGLDEGWDLSVALEAQQSMPGQGVSSTFTTGQGFGRLEGLLTGLWISYEVVRPQRWMRAMGIPAGADKAKHVEVAQSMYPKAGLTGPRGRKLDGRADALLIATWAMRETGKQ